MATLPGEGMTASVHSEVRGQLGILTLTRARALNALDTGMAVQALEVLAAWRDDPGVRAVWLQGEGDKGFCAGGDVRAIALEHRTTPTDAFARAYFEAEYRLDWALHTYPKPVLVWGHGFVMGGGVGMLLGGAVRIVTESTRLAMPEIRIGLFPDVGAAWFLSRLGGRGAWLALTAARVTAGDAIDCGLADVHVPDASRGELMDALSAAELAGMDHVVGVVAPFLAPSGHRYLRGRADRLDVLFRGEDEAVLHRMAQLQDDADPWIAAGAKTLGLGSPTSARVILEQLRRARQMSLADVLRQDFDLAVQCVRRPDFHAGVGAVLIDKSGTPSWETPSADDVWAHFEAPVEPHPLADLVGVGRHERPGIG